MARHKNRCLYGSVAQHIWTSIGIRPLVPPMNPSAQSQLAQFQLDLEAVEAWTAGEEQLPCLRSGQQH